MKRVLVLKHPNIDIIADINENSLTGYLSLSNVFVVQWIDKYVKMIPFKAAKHLAIIMNEENIAMMFDADDKLALIHDEEIKKEIPPFISEEEHLELIRKNQEKVNKTLGK